MFKCVEIREPDGKIARAVFRYLRLVAAEGYRAPSHSEIGDAIGFQSGAISTAMKTLLNGGYVQIRADRVNHTRRCYRIVQTGHETLGYGLGLPVDEISGKSRGHGATSVLAALTAIAERGGRVELAELRGRAHLSLAKVSDALAALEGAGDIEVRVHAVNKRLRAYRIVASGQETEGFADGEPVPPQAPRQATGARPRDVLDRRGATGAKRVKRKCMACDTIFLSSGPGHRLCAQHRHASDSVTVHRIAS